MSDPFEDPIEVEGEADYLKPADLRNQVCLIHPTGEGVEPGRPDPDTGEVRPWEFVVCDVATLDRSGIVAFSHDVRISWKRVRSALREKKGIIIAGKFVQAEGASAVELRRLDGAARETARRCFDEFRHRCNNQTTTEPVYTDEDLEPF